MISDETRHTIVCIADRKHHFTCRLIWQSRAIVDNIKKLGFCQSMHWTEVRDLGMPLFHCDVYGCCMLITPIPYHPTQISTFSCRSRLIWNMMMAGAKFLSLLSRCSGNWRWVTQQLHVFAQSRNNGAAKDGSRGKGRRMRDATYLMAKMNGFMWRSIMKTLFC